jgi:hypothetical protein
VFRSVDFCVQNELKFTYVHLQFQKFFRGLYPRTPVKKGRGGEGGEGPGRRGRKGEKGRGWETGKEEERQGERPREGGEGPGERDRAGEGREGEREGGREGGEGKFGPHFQNRAAAPGRAFR